MKKLKKTLCLFVVVNVICFVLSSCSSVLKKEDTNFVVYIENKSDIVSSNASLMIMSGDSVIESQTAKVNDNSFTIVFDKSMISPANRFNISILCHTDLGDFTYYDTLSLSEDDITPICYELTGTSTSDLVLERV